MKTYIRTNLSKFHIKKRVLLICSSVIIVLITFMTVGCIEEDYPVRLVYPVLTTTAVTSITSSTAVSGGDITDDGGYEITARGICWSVEPNPSVANKPDSLTVSGTGAGQFTSNLTGLKASKTYYVRAYATNSQATAYGPNLTFTTAPE